MGTWASVKNRAARDFTTAETALVFKTNPRLFAYLGIAMMGLGGLSIIFGVFQSALPAPRRQCFETRPVRADGP